jgi:hypothetical protein
LLWKIIYLTDTLRKLAEAQEKTKNAVKSTAAASKYAALQRDAKKAAAGFRIIDHKDQCNWAGCVHLQRVCDQSNHCSFNWGISLKGEGRAAYSVDLYWSISINGHHVIGPVQYGHHEPGIYKFHGSWGLPNPGKGTDRGYYECGLFNALTCHLSPSSTIYMEFSGNIIMRGGKQGYLWGYGKFYSNS